ncbi:HEAT repeat domain-containing protein, partial [Planctomycetota bacterium]
QSKAFGTYLRKQLASNHCIVLLDAWDEVPDIKQKRKLRKMISEFSSTYQGKVMLTSRIVGYDLTQPPLSNAMELELIAWDWSQIESFVNVWFEKDRQRAGTFLRKLKRHSQFRGLARIPLILNLLCQAYPGGELPNRRSDLYKTCLWGLLRDWHIYDKEHIGRYREDELSDAYISGLIEVWEQLSLQLYQNGGIQQFKEDNIRPILESLLNDLHRNRPCHELVNEKASPTSLLRRFKNDGILISTSSAESRQYRFIHLTFQEYLVAGALARRTDCLDIVMSHVYDPLWNHVMVLLGGTLDNPMPYVAALLRANQHDILCRPLLIVLAVISEAAHIMWPKNVIEMLTQQVLTIYFGRKCSYLLWMFEDVIKYLSIAERELITLLSKCEEDDIYFIARGLEKVGTEKAVPQLAQILKESEDHNVYEHVINAMRAIGGDHAAEMLIDVIQETHDDHKCLGALLALSSVDSEKAVPYLMTEIKKGEDVNWHIIDELISIGGEEVAASLNDILNDDISTAVRKNVIEVLGGIGGRKPLFILMQLIKTEVKFHLRLNIIEAIGCIGGETGVSALANLLYEEEDGRVWRKIVGELGKSKGIQAIEVLSKILEDDNEPWCHECAVEALGKIGDVHSTDVLFKTFGTTQNVPTRRAAAEAISRIDSDQARHAMAQVLEKDEKDDDVLINAVIAVDRVRAKHAFPSLLRIINNGEDSRNRSRAISLLGKIGDSTAHDALREFIEMDDQDEYDRLWAAEGLGVNANSQTIETLIKMMNTTEDEVIFSHIITLLGKKGCSRSIQELLQILRTSEEEITRERIIRILIENGYSQIESLLIDIMENDRDINLRRYAAESLGVVGRKPAIMALIQVLKSDVYFGVRAGAAKALGLIGDKEIVPNLSESLEKKGLSVECMVAEALRRICVGVCVSPNDCNLPDQVQKEFNALTDKLNFIAAQCDGTQGEYQFPI